MDVQQSTHLGGYDMKKLLVLSAFAAMLASGTALADTSGKKIAFSNNYAGNSWRQAMLDSYGIVTKKAVDDAIHAGILEGVAAHPEFKIVGSVTGDWDQTTAQKAVATILPSLPDVVGIVDQGGDGYGAAQAFAAAGKPRPTIIMGNRQDELQWWKEQKEKDGYKTWSASIAPGVSTLAFWVAQQILDGNKDVPHDLLVPYLAFTQDDFEAALPTIEKGSVASHEYTQEDAIKAIKANMK